MAQTERDSRWITVRQPFDYRWPSGAITAFRIADAGEHLVKNELADFAVERGYATEGKVDGSARSKKGGKKRVRRANKAAVSKEASPATTADTGSATGMGGQNPSDADSATDGRPVDSAAG